MNRIMQLSAEAPLFRTAFRGVAASNTRTRIQYSSRAKPEMSTAQAPSEAAKGVFGPLKVDVDELETQPPLLFLTPESI